MNKKVFITGGASGLGKALALKFAKAKFDVCIGDINFSEGEKVVEKINSNFKVKAFYADCDVQQEASIQTVANDIMNKWGRVDVVVNNAGVAASAPIEDGSMQDWEWIVNINLLGVARGCKVFTPIFKSQGKGYFINIASMAGIVHLPYMSSYNATKAAVIALSETLKVELMEDNIGVTAVCPSFFKTNLDASMRSNEAMKMVVKKLFDRSPLQADDVAEMIYATYKKGDFLLVTHKKAKTALFMKKLLPINLFHKNLYKETIGLRKRK